MKKFLILILTFAASANASDIIPSIYSTGVNDFYNTLSNGDIDFHYLVRSPQNTVSNTYAVNPQMVADPSGAGPRSRWLDPSTLSPTAKWISFSSDPTTVDNRLTYDYETYFNIDGFDINSVMVSGQISSSGGTSVYLNGNYLFSHYSIPTADTYMYLTGFSFSNSSGFLLPGINKLSFEVSNGSPSMTFTPPNGILLSMSGTGNIVPEPSSYILCAVGTIALILARRK